MKKLALFLIPVVLLLCTSGVEKDKEALKDYIAGDTILFNTTTHFEGRAVSDSGDTLPPSTFDTLNTVLWGREITSHPEPEIEIEINGDSAYVIYTGHNLGTIDLFYMLPDSSYKLLKKLLSETFEIRAIFKRLGNTDDEYRGWKLTNISGSIGQSDSVATVKIDSIRITTSTTKIDTLITDPMTIIDTANVMVFKPLEEVTITVYTNTLDAKLFLHTFILIWPYHIRIPFTNNGDGSYTGTWHVQLIPSIRFAIFDMLHWDTLYDDNYSYDFMGWLIPYIILP
ncbi:hypothetical protein DRP53_03095 [candidate division WOR-3 bacterium]|uniref:Uncharacterized protein n=1 Tax=candidate division WOR-3 bacterium TaxID=2052148 RepID=A0A660SJL1_UNCW3|nr:MAG: hypothetical protein DRP53_03095 [candidate division WOR-3 bacterium]